MKKQADLSELARHFMSVNKDRPEVSLVIGTSLFFPIASHSLSDVGVGRLLVRMNAGLDGAGNYYSLRNEHEKAVRYYQRAVQLHPTYGAAWTLMGHEYLEMKNSHAAIEAYRRGIGKSTVFHLCLTLADIGDGETNGVR